MEPTTPSLPDDDVAAIDRLGAIYKELSAELSKIIIGQQRVVELLSIALFSRGHALLMGVPGLAKTLLISSVAKTLDLSFNRIQFTPDLMPADITGTDIIQDDSAGGKRQFEFIKGPVFANIVLADEINRAPAKTQSALLEAMQERRVTVMGRTFTLLPPFFVLATQNPIEQEGTYPLPEAQLDRFFMRLSLGYMTREQEMEVVSRPSTADILNSLEPVVSPEVIQEMKELYTKVRVQKDVLGYMMDIVEKTRTESRFVTGVSTRGAIALYKASQAMAASLGRDFVIPEDVKAAAPWVLSHRIISRGGESFEDARKYLGQIMEDIPVPMENLR